MKNTRLFAAMSAAVIAVCAMSYGAFAEKEDSKAIAAVSGDTEATDSEDMIATDDESYLGEITTDVEVEFAGRIYSAVTDNEDCIVKNGRITFHNPTVEDTDASVTDGEYSVKLGEGKYNVVIEAEGYVTRNIKSVDVSATDGETTAGEDFFLLRPADVNGDGKVDIEDAAIILGQINGVKTLEATYPEYGDYAKAVADVNNDKKVDIEDIVRIISHINGEKPLY